MPKRPTKTTKSRVASKSNKKKSLKFNKWWVVAGIGVIAIAGVVIVRFSQAAKPQRPVYDAWSFSCNTKGGAMWLNPQAGYPKGYYIPVPPQFYPGNKNDCILYAKWLLDGYFSRRNGWFGSAWTWAGLWTPGLLKIGSTSERKNNPYFDEKLQGYVKFFQAKEGIPAHGHLDDATWRKLLTACYVQLKCVK